MRPYLARPMDKLNATWLLRRMDDNGEILIGQTLVLDGPDPEAAVFDSRGAVFVASGVVQDVGSADVASPTAP